MLRKAKIVKLSHFDAFHSTFCLFSEYSLKKLKITLEANMYVKPISVIHFEAFFGETHTNAIYYTSHNLI